jgi:hypothetical protein
MIVIAQNLVLAPLAAEPLYLPCLGYDNVLAAPGTLTTTNAVSGYPASNMQNPSTVDLWRGTGANNIVGDVNPVHPVDYIAIARHNFGSAHIPITVQGRASGSLPEENWVTQIVQHTLADDAPVIYRFTPAAFQDVRLVLGVGAANPECAVFYCGKLLTFQRGTQGGYTPLTDARTAEIMTGQSEDGNYLGRIITGARTQSQASFHGLDPAWCRSGLRPFLDASLTTPFFFAWSPQAYPQEVGFAWLGTPANVSFDLENYGNIDLDMVGIVK